MDYTTDTSAAVAEILEQQYRTAKQAEANHAIDVAKIEFCADVLAVAGKDPDPALVEAATAATIAGSEASKKAAQVEKRITPLDLTANRREWLAAYIAHIEGEHAQHGVLIELATETGDTAQIEASTVAQITIDGAHKAAVAELASFGVVVAALDAGIAPAPRQGFAGRLGLTRKVDANAERAIAPTTTSSLPATPPHTSTSHGRFTPTDIIWAIVLILTLAVTLILVAFL